MGRVGLPRHHRGDCFKLFPQTVSSKFVLLLYTFSFCCLFWVGKLVEVEQTLLIKLGKIYVFVMLVDSISVLIWVFIYITYQ